MESKTSKSIAPEPLPSRALIAVVIPCYQECEHILSILNKIGDEVKSIYVVDDACPDKTGNFVKKNTKDSRIKVIRHEKNLGVGGATLTGYQHALDDGHEIIVKIDGDGQMEPSFIPVITAPIIGGSADYSKGNRFHSAAAFAGMPATRIFGNICLSIMSKLSTGYWDIFDPTNGFTAIHASALKKLSDKKISHGYFFESDMLFWLGKLRAVVKDVPMAAIYGNEKSGIILMKVIPEFFFKHIINGIKRLYFTYFLSSPGVATIQLTFGTIFLLFGIIFGSYHWFQSYYILKVPATAGTVILAALPIILGTQLIFGFLNFDIENVPKSPIQKKCKSFT